MRSFIARRRWGTGMLLGFAVFLLSAGSAAASGGPSFITIGPVKAANGYKLTINSECNARAFSGISASKSGSGYTLGHFYNDSAKRAATCTSTRKLKSAKLTMRWGKFAKGTLKFRKAGALHKLKVPKGCTTTIHERKLKSTGTLTIKIHTGSFGKLVLHHVSAVLEGTGKYSCKGGPSTYPSVVFLSAGWNKGQDNISADQVANHTSRDLSVSAPDNLSKAVRGSLGDSFTGSKVFSYKSDLSSASIHSATQFLQGSLTYKASAACSAGSTSGTLKGKLTLHDPVSGTLTFPGSEAQYPFLQRSTGSC